jgi:hypothetical protein
MKGFVKSAPISIVPRRRAFLAVACVGFLASAPAVAEDDGDGDEALDGSLIVVEGQVQAGRAEGPQGDRRSGQYAAARSWSCPKR